MKGWLAHSTVVLALAVVGFTHSVAKGDVVTDWNEVLLDIVRSSKLSPPVATRSLAMMHVAIADAVAGCTGDFAPYCSVGLSPAGANPDAAAARAAYDVLAALYPDYATLLSQNLAASLASIPDNRSRRDGIAWGQICSRAILDLRATDGWNRIQGYVPPIGPGYWVSTPPAYAPALLPNWPLVLCWVLPTGATYRGEGPPALESAAYLEAFNEVREYGRKDGSARTLDQTAIALFWDDGAGSATPPGHWNQIARTVAYDRRNNMRQNARMLALLNLALADAAMVAWDNKYAHHHWRPITAIRQAYADGNPATAPDSTWTPLLTTPPFPEYVSGHSTFSGASSRILARFFGDDQVPFTAESDLRPGAFRFYGSFSQAAEEAGQSRIYGGIHFQYSNRDGLAAGRALADDVFSSFLRLVADVDGDGKRNSSDLQLVVNAYLHGATDASTDVDQNGRIDARDIQRAVNALLSEY